MYPLTHFYVTKLVLNKLNPGLALGSILPDILVGAGLDWQTAHNYKDLVTENKDIILGDLIHGTFLPGLDYYSDCSYDGKEGYAFQHARYLYEDIVKLGVPKNHALWRGHNFIEMAVECSVNAENNFLWQYLESAAGEKHLLNEIHLIIASYNLNQKIVSRILKRFLAIRGETNYLAQDYSRKLNNVYALNLVAPQCLAILNKAADIITCSCGFFLDTCIEKITVNLTKLKDR